MLLNVFAALGVGAALLAAPAGARDLDPAMKQYVIASCSGDAFRLCPTSLTSEQDAVACMRTKRSELNKVCRVAYDKVVRTLAQ